MRFNEEIEMQERMMFCHMIAFTRLRRYDEDSTVGSSSLLESRLKQVVVTAVLLSLAIFCPFASAHSQEAGNNDVRYTLSPIVNGTAWNSKLGLKNAVLYGGKLGIDFGPMIGLEASYLTSGDIWTDFSSIDLRDSAGVLIGDQRVRIRRIGGDLIVTWPSGRLAPFVKAGGGVIRFEPESGPNVEKIDVRIGGGLDYIVNSRLRTRAWIEMNSFRLDRYTLAPGGVENGAYPIDPDAEKIRDNLSIGLSLDYAIGQGRFGSATGERRLHPFSALEVEPMLGRLDFDDARMGTTTLAGARIGGELNPWVGWGLYYWHAMESDLSDTRPLQSYGGEARFRLASKIGPQPYVTVGVGQLDFRSAYADSEGTGRDDKTALILGAGIRAEVFRGLELNVGVRDLMYGEEPLDRVSGTDDISHNWLLSGAMVFGIGGRGGSEKRPPVSPTPVYHTTSLTESKQDSSTVTVKEAMPQDSSKTTANVVPTEQQSGYVSDKNVVIPVPLEGEIYIRYGKTSRDLGETALRGITRPVDTTSETAGIKTEPAEVDSGGAETSDIPPVRPDTSISSPLAPNTESGISVTRTELDSLITALKTDIASMLAAQKSEERTTTGVATPDTATVAAQTDSLVTALQKQLAASEQERKRLDSLLQVPSPTTQIEPDSLAEKRIQQQIADQVAAALATRSDESENEITQADLQSMMAALTARMDSVTSQRAAVDSARLRDQLQLEIVRQTKSQEEFQRAMEDFVRRYGEQQQSKSVPPAIIVTQPAPTPQVIESDRPSTVLIQPDTQYVVIRDSTGQEKASLPITGLDVSGPAQEKDFIDLRPTGYTGFGLERPKQFIVGGRLDIGPITAKEEKLRLVPEFALGLGGGGVSIMAVMNAEYLIADIQTGDYRLVPYARMGFGVLGFGGDIEERDTEGVLNITYGLSIDPRKTGLFRGIGYPAIFVEHQIIDLFDLNRVVLGFQWSR